MFRIWTLLMLYKLKHLKAIELQILRFQLVFQDAELSLKVELFWVLPEQKVSFEGVVVGSPPCAIYYGMPWRIKQSPFLFVSKNNIQIRVSSNNQQEKTSRIKTHILLPLETQKLTPRIHEHQHPISNLKQSPFDFQAARQLLNEGYYHPLPAIHFSIHLRWVSGLGFL